MTIQAIETRYAGCVFRSRLEARWAVFFDELGIEWEYEPQGFNLPWRLTFAEGVIRYLPDFYLPSLKTWVEVKGSWSEAECRQFLNAAAALSAPDGGCGEVDVALVSSIPNPDTWRRWRPVLLHMHKGDLDASPALFDRGGCHADGVTIARDVGGPDAYLSDDMKSMLQGFVSRTGLYYAAADDRYCAALNAARSARFEHGHSGAVR